MADSPVIWRVACVGSDGWLRLELEEVVMSRAAWIAILAALVAATAGIFYYHYLQQPAGSPPAAAAGLPTEAAPAVPAQPAPQAEYPVPPPASNAAPLPALNDSDSTLADVAASLFGKSLLAPLLVPRQLIRHFVVTVDSLDGEPVPLRDRPLRSVPSLPVVSSSDGTLLWSADNARRYQPYIALLKAADTGKLVDTYLRFYPLFQAAYEELGYRDRQFNTRLIAVIDHLLATPAIDGPIELVRPKVLYEFADPNLEALSSGQKLMLRIGSDNTATVMSKLREIRAGIVARGKQN